VIQIFATGKQVRGAVTGSVTPAPAPESTDRLFGSIGGVPANIQYAGPAPGQIAGLLQVNAVVPDTAPTGPTVPIGFINPPHIMFDRTVYGSQAGVTIAVQ
jgi:uncharacterized protein (TIGR03437 family)